MTQPNLILASGSPRRREFMHALGLSFAIRAADIDERTAGGEQPQDLVARLSREKAQAVAAQEPDAVVIGADTIVTLDGEMLGKPVDPDDAVTMLRQLRDRPHAVYSGITVCPAGGGEPQTAVVGTTVWMRAYTDLEIATYVDSGDPLDKAGAYAIQHPGFAPVARIQGCYASVMGLPVQELVHLLARAGIVPPVDAGQACVSLTGFPCCGGTDVVLEMGP